MLSDSRKSDSKQALTFLDGGRRTSECRIVKSAAKLKRRG